MKQDFYAIHAKLIADADPMMIEEVQTSVSEDIALLKLAIDLRASRKISGLTQVQLAQKTGITQSEISRIEKGVYSPRLSTLVKLARTLKTDFVIRGDESVSAQVA